jgi:hypothetical protein
MMSEGSSKPSWAHRNGSMRFFWTLAIFPSGKSLSPESIIHCNYFRKFGDFKTFKNFVWFRQTNF